MRDIYQDVTDRIVAELETGAAPWVKPWTVDKSALAALPHNAATHRPYNGINILMLWLSAAAAGYSTTGFVTFKQAKERGGHVKKGERGHQIVFVKKLDVRDTSEPEASEDATRQVTMLRGFTVFNLDQCEGLDRLRPAPRVERPALLAQGAFQEFVSATRAVIRHGGNEAFYVPSRDFIQMPHALDFRDSATYEATLLHELTHWSGHPSRVARELSGRFKTQAYAAEELIAELGAAFLCAHLGVRGELRHAGYIESWLKLLRSDKKAIFTAASAASKAADYLRLGADQEAEGGAMTLYHVTVVMPTRDENPGAKRETRIFTRRRRRAAEAKAAELRACFPGSPVDIRAAPATDRAPVIFER